MSYVRPDGVVAQMVRAGAAKAALRPRDLLIRGGLAGALLGVATTLAASATAQLGLPIVVNMFVIPAGIMLGAHITAVDWWVWNQIP